MIKYCNSIKNSDMSDNKDSIEIEYLRQGYKISQDYKNYRRIYLGLNIGFMSFFSLAIKFVLEIFEYNVYAFNILIFGFILLLISTSGNIFYNLLKHETKPRAKTWVHYRDHSIKTFEEFEEYHKITHIENHDLNQLFNMFKFQEKYYKLLKRTRIITLASIFSFMISFTFSSILLVIL